MFLSTFLHEITLKAIDIDNIGCLEPFLGPRGPLVLPLVGPSVRPVRPARKIWITYIQAYMLYE